MNPHVVKLGSGCWGGAGTKEKYLENTCLAKFDIDGVTRFASIPDPPPAEIELTIGNWIHIFALTRRERCLIYGTHLYALSYRFKFNGRVPPEERVLLASREARARE